MVAPMLQTLDYAPALLKWTEGNTGLQLQRLVKLDSEIDPPIQGGASLFTFQVAFYAEDPRAYSQTPTTVTSSVVSTLLANGTFASDVVGAAPAHWTVTTGSFSTAKVDNPTLDLYTTKALALVATLGVGASAAIECDQFAVAANTDYAVAVGAYWNTVYAQAAGGGVQL